MRIRRGSPQGRAPSVPPTPGFPASSHQVVRQKYKPPAHKAPAVSHALLLFRARWGKHGATRKVSEVSTTHPRARSLVQGPGTSRGVCESIPCETQTFLGKGLTASARPAKGRCPGAPTGRGVARITVAPLPPHSTPTCIHTAHLSHYLLVGFPRGSCI